MGRALAVWASAAALSAALLMPQNAWAASLTLSDASSNSRVDASLLDATLSFEINADNQLVLTVTNLTDVFRIQQVFFNATNDVTGLTLADAPEGWSLRKNRSANGFGKFDFGLFGKRGRNGAAIDAGQSLVFTFDISGDLSEIDATDFVIETSRKKRKAGALAAARFRGQPGHGNAWGAVLTATLPPGDGNGGGGDNGGDDGNGDNGGGDGGNGDNGGGTTPGSDTPVIPLPSAAVMGLALLAGLAGRRSLRH